MYSGIVNSFCSTSGNRHATLVIIDEIMLKGVLIININKIKKYHTVGTIPISNIQIVERGKIDTSNTQITNRSLSWPSTGTSIKSGRIKLALWAHSSPFSEMIRSCKCFYMWVKCQLSRVTWRTTLL